MEQPSATTSGSAYGGEEGSAAATTSGSAYGGEEDLDGAALQPPDQTAPVEQSDRATSMSERHRRRVKMGVVRSDKMDKTIVVVTETRVPHPVYKKIVRKSVRFKAHDEKNDAKIGDTVRIAETRPMSRDKRWRLLEIVERAK